MLPGQKNVWANRKMGPKKYFRKLNGPKKLQNKWAAMYKKAGLACYKPANHMGLNWLHFNLMTFFCPAMLAAYVAVQ